LHLSGNVLLPLDDEATGHLGRPVWDARKLLDDLALRLGLSRHVASAGVRVQQWSRRVSKLMAQSTGAPPYFAKAYRDDPTGTAAQLLRLRDELVEAGWDGAPLTGATRLVTLTQLSTMTDTPLPPGRADCLAAVEAELQQVTWAPYLALDLVDAPALWPGRWRRVFSRLAALGVRFEAVPQPRRQPSVETDLQRFQRALQGERQDKTRPLAGDGSLVLLRGPTSSALAEAAAAFLAADQTLSTVIVRGADEGPLDAALARQGLARQGVRESSRWRPALQVLRLALAVAFEPRDPRRVLELVTLSSGPFAGRAGHLLAAALCERPGLGNAEWQRAKEQLSEEQRARVEVWLEEPRLNPAKAPRDAVLRVAERVLEWLRARSLARPEPSWASASAQAQTFVDALRIDPRAQLERPAIEQLLQDLTEERATCIAAIEEMGRLDHVDSPDGLLVARERVLWWSFVGEPSLKRPSFRSQELDVLARAGLPVVDPALTLRGRFEGMQRAVHAATRQLVLVIPECVAGMRCTPHPLLDELVGRL
jgi:hypothetical protein